VKKGNYISYQCSQNIYSFDDLNYYKKGDQFILFGWGGEGRGGEGRGRGFVMVYPIFNNIQWVQGGGRRRVRGGGGGEGGRYTIGGEGESARGFIE
jgi:hypothetical protein